MDGGNLDFLLFSNAPNGDFDGFCGFIRRITLMVYMGLDNVLNRQETRYDTTLVIGLTACAMGIFSFFVYFIMKVQSCQTLFCGTPGALNQLPEIVDEDEDDKDEDKTKVDEQTSTEDSISTGSDLSVQGRSPKLGKRGRSKKSPKGKHRNKELINHFMQAADVGHCLFNYNDRKKSPERQPRVQLQRHSKCQP
ncbi:uncharacterized protein LOC120457058 isoform X2 [Drosophila santomea]|uniref:uncharacterized protein LOC120457058 isoform X2 n=1 Tax=Drosophila santomea TaxID=129105 RepID=UPI001952DFC3|nr:uncharacterized protein LOC120457058 isoform X2 [Drosophila santomea]